MIKVTILAEGKNQITELFVTWTPPEWAFGSFKPEHDEFIRGLSHALPNIKIVSNY